MPNQDTSEKTYLCASPALRRLPLLEQLLGGTVLPLGWGGLGLGPAGAKSRSATAVLAWGRKPSASRAERAARRLGQPVLRLEDGFLRSFGTGDRFPPLSLMVDGCGIYYDSTTPSALENLLNSDALPTPAECEAAQRAIALMREHRLSKYNHAPGLSPGTLRDDDQQRVLVVDQTAGDLSVSLGAASADTFDAMLRAAHAENPRATVYVKTHPEASSGRKRGYLTGWSDTISASGQRTVMLRQPVNPMELIEQMDRVYVVTSTMGFEALLAGKKVTCFGLPWYAGWGATDDRQACPRRHRKRSVEELFVASYLRMSRYINPWTHAAGDIFGVIEWLVLQRQAAGLTGTRALTPTACQRIIGVGFPRWRAFNLGPLLTLQPERLAFVRSTRGAAQCEPGPEDALVCWGRNPPPGLEALAQTSGATLFRAEDGFVRSVGLGSDLIRPQSLVLDSEGIYFDPTRPSALERVLNTCDFAAQELARASEVRRFIVQHDITKYNLEPIRPASWPCGKRVVVLVPGQVEDDASILHGCTDIRTNLALLEVTREACPDAYIVYKPHPDVASGNRRGRVTRSDSDRLADHVENELSIVACVNACDELHTMTSLTGFDALLRGKRVVVHGRPFYAGWGLTIDKGGPVPGRERRLSLDELVVAALLRYPVYWDWTLGGYTRCEATLNQILRERQHLVANGSLEKLRSGTARRLARKLAVVLRAWTHRLVR